MCVCIHVSVCVCVCVYTCDVCMYVCMCVCVYMCVCVCVYTCDVCVYACVCVYTCMCVCIHVCVCMCVQDFMGKSDPFLQVSGRTNDGTLQIVWKTEVIFLQCPDNVHMWVTYTLLFIVSK